MLKERKHTYLSDLHFENRLWLNQLAFCDDELEIYDTRLAELIEKNNSVDFASSAEALQNRLIRQNDVIDELKHEIRARESALASYAEVHPIAVDHVYFSDHQDIREKMERFTQLYAEFKDEFNRFTAKWF